MGHRPAKPSLLRRGPEPGRWPIDRATPSAAAPRSWLFATVGLSVVLFAIAVGVSSMGAPLRVTLAAVALLVAGAALRTRRRPRPPAGWLELDEHGLARIEGERRTTLLEWGVRQGVTVLANCVRTRVLVAFTSRSQTRYVRVRTAETSPEAFAWLGEHAVSVADGDLSSPDDEPELEGDHAVEVLRRCLGEDPGLLGRVFLTSARGEPVELDGRRLTVGAKEIDLDASLEWKASTFHESFGPLTTVYQATEIVQNHDRVVLVAQMPGELSMGGDFASAQRRDPALRTSVMADLKLIQATPEPPPSTDARIAIDRLFVVPLRRALDRAPRAKRIGPMTESAARPTMRSSDHH